MMLFRLLGIITLISGVRLLGGGIYNYVDEHNQNDWIQTTAYVTDVSSEYVSSSGIKHRRGRTVYDITYQYEVHGESYSDKLYNRSEVMGIGDEVKIKYDPDTPKNSTDILKPSMKNLIVFLISGTIFTIVGFFLSGVWAFVQKMRHRGEPEEKEILPPEEYVSPEERRKMPQKQSSPIGRRTVVGLLSVVCIFLGIRLFLGVQSIGVKEFAETVQKAGYTTTDTTETLRREWKVGSILERAVSINEDDLRMDFAVMDTEKSADTLFNGMVLPLSDGDVKERKGRVHELYSIENKELYIAKVRMKNAVIYTSVRVERKNEIVELLDRFEHWKDK